MRRAILYAFPFLFLSACPRPVIICTVLEEIDPVAGSCRRVSESPDRLWHPVGAEVSGRTVFLFGSYGSMRFDLEKGAWAEAAPCPEKGSVEVQAVEVQDRILVFGEKLAWAYDPAKDAWEARAPLPLKRYACGAALLDGKVYLAGGDTVEGVTNRVDAYDPAADSWERKADLLRARTELVLQCAKGRLWALGGHARDKAKHIPVEEVESYDPAKDAWSPEGRADLACRVRPVSAAIGGAIWVILPRKADGDSVVLRFDPANGTSSSTRSSVPIRRDECAFATRDGKIYVWGGFTNEYDVEDGPDGTDRIVFR
jgi:hypothetical protein